MRIQVLLTRVYRNKNPPIPYQAMFDDMGTKMGKKMGNEFHHPKFRKSIQTAPISEPNLPDVFSRITTT